MFLILNELEVIIAGANESLIKQVILQSSRDPILDRTFIN